MATNELKRLIYFKGQHLTAQDFIDQQNYHREKLGQFVQRFPQGIIRGLKVEFEARNGSHEFDAFKIKDGVAIDFDRNILIVPDEGILIDIADFDKDVPFLSIKYFEKEGFADHSALFPSKRNNRKIEIVDISWDAESNPPSNKNHVTVAKIEENGNGDFKIIYEEAGEPKIRIDAALIDEEQIVNGAVTSQKIANDAVKNAQIADNAVDTPQIAGNAVENAQIADGAVDTPQIANDAVENAQIANNAVDTPQIADDAVKNAQIANNAVDTPQIADDAVKNRQIAIDAVDTLQIANGSVLKEKLSIITLIENRTLIPGVTDPFPVPSIEVDAIIQIIPLGPEALSWSIKKITPNGDKLDYVLIVENLGTLNTDCQVRKINLGNL